MIRQMRHVVSLRRHPLERPATRHAHAQPEHLSAGHLQPQGGSTSNTPTSSSSSSTATSSVPSHLHGLPVARHHAAEAPLGRVVGEVVQEVASDEVARVQVRAVGAEHVQLLVGQRGHLVQAGGRGPRAVGAHRADADVAQVGDVKRAVGRHGQGRGSLQSAVTGIASISCTRTKRSNRIKKKTIIR